MPSGRNISSEIAKNSAEKISVFPKAGRYYPRQVSTVSPLRRIPTKITIYRWSRYKNRNEYTAARLPGGGSFFVDSQPCPRTQQSSPSSQSGRQAERRAVRRSRPREWIESYTGTQKCCVFLAIFTPSAASPPLHQTSDRGRFQFRFFNSNEARRIVNIQLSGPTFGRSEALEKDRADSRIEAAKWKPFWSSSS